MRGMLEEVLGVVGVWAPGRTLYPIEKIEKHGGKLQGQPNRR